MRNECIKIEKDKPLIIGGINTVEIGTPKEIRVVKQKEEKKVAEGQVDIGIPDKYELFFRRPDIVQALLTLETDNFKMNLKDVVKVTAEELLYWGGTLQGAAHGLNRVFVASAVAGEGLRMPFYARVRKNKMQLGRIGETFDISNYMADSYQKPHVGEGERVKAWLLELSKVGIKFEAEKGKKWQPIEYQKAGELVKKIPASIVEDTEKGLEKAKEEYIAQKDAITEEKETQAKALQEHLKAEKEKAEATTETTETQEEADKRIKETLGEQVVAQVQE